MKMQYRIISNRLTTILQDAVSMAIDQGWKPVGGLTYEPPSYQNPPAFHQVMIKEE